MAQVLIVQQDETTAGYIRNILKKGGHAVTAARDALDAWRAVSRGGCDILLIDMSMPGVEGFVLAQRALQENPATQIIFVTGFSAVAMDAQATPAYAPAPVTSRAFHLKNLNARLRAMAITGACGSGDIGCGITDGSNVVFADFAAKTPARQQA